MRDDLTLWIIGRLLDVQHRMVDETDEPSDNEQILDSLSDLMIRVDETERELLRMTALAEEWAQKAQPPDVKEDAGAGN